MRLKELIDRCKAAGITEVELHPDGSPARLVFGPRLSITPKPVLTTDERLKLEQEKRNPRRDSLDLAVEVQGDVRSRYANG